MGTLIGSTLGNSVYRKSGNGVVFNASVRDFHSSFLERIVLIDLIHPYVWAHAIVQPGDLVITDREGILFIRAQLAKQVTSTAEFVSQKDKFDFEMVKSNCYNKGQIDSQWTYQITTDFLD